MVVSLERLFVAAMLGAIALAFAFADPAPARADHFPCHAPNRGWGFDTYEYEDYVGKYNQLIDLAVRGWAVPPAYSVGEEKIDVTYQGVESGPRGSRLAATPSNGIPPSVYKSIAWIESGWSHAAGNVPYGGTGSVITAIDCGYGIGQITTGMGHLSTGGGALEPGVASARQAIIGSHPVFNVAEGIRILADKWNGAPNLRPVAGQGDPAVLEDWYYAIWSYNGFAFSNHPMNPNKDPLRGSVWNCADPTAPGYGFYEWGDYTYPEKVYGCMRYPPVPKGADYPPRLNGSGNPLPPVTPITVGDTVNVFGTGNGLNIRATASTSAAILAVVPDGTALAVVGGPQAANGFTWWNVQGGGVTGWAAAQFLAKPSPEPEPDAPVNPLGRMWPPQVFSMPNLASPEIASAMTTSAFLNCEDGGFAAGCSLMDFPTVPHYDASPPGNPSDASYFLGDPAMVIEGSRTVSISAAATTATSSPVTIRNNGTGLAPFRVRTSADWLIVTHPGETRVIDGGVAIGKNYEVVSQKTPRIFTSGRDSLLQITVDPRFLSAGTHKGTVTIDALLGSGAPATFTVTVTSSGGGGAGSGTTPTPTPTPTQAPTSYRAIVPGLISEGGH